MKNVALDLVNVQSLQIYSILAKRKCSHIPPAEGSVTDYGQIYSSSFPELEMLLNVGRTGRLAG